MFCHQQGEVGVFRLLFRIFITVAIDGDDAVGVLIHYSAFGVHAECAHLVPIFLGTVDNLAFVQLICQVGKYLSRQLHPNANVHPVGFHRDLQLPANGLHPFAAAAAYGNHTLPAGIGLVLAMHLVAVFHY